MKRTLQMENVIFLIDQDIIYCKFKKCSNRKGVARDIDEVFHTAITSLTDGRYLPLLMDMRETNLLSSIRLFKHLAKSSKVKSTLLSKTFIANSIFSTIILNIYNLTFIHSIPVAICNRYNAALKCCKKHYKEFNAIREKTC